ncbi:MAG TPA: hypothetical protein VJJ53_02165 [Candidatus Nanoarchaeia archaeon]|nr:hypothetical protein [Candidatus Nanoarchaeia archaeon]
MMKKENKTDFVSYVGIIVSIVIGLVSLYGQSKNPQTSLFLFLSLIGTIFLFFLISWPIDYFNKKFKHIDKNIIDVQEIKKDLNIIKDKLKFKEEVFDLSNRISIIENTLKMKNKRGQIDPRWILIIFIIILFYLYIKSKGFKFFF